MKLMFAGALFATLSVLAHSPREAAAEPAKLDISGGALAQIIAADECPSGGLGYFCEDEIRRGLVGVAPFVAIAYTKKTTRKRGWRFRFGPQIMATAMADNGARAGLVSASMNVGFHFHSFFAEAGGGMTALSFRAPGYSARGVTMNTHYLAGIDLSPNWALTARADLHVVAHSDFGAAGIGVGLQFTP